MIRTLACLVCLVAFVHAETIVHYKSEHFTVQSEVTNGQMSPPIITSLYGNSDPIDPTGGLTQFSSIGAMLRAQYSVQTIFIAEQLMSGPYLLIADLEVATINNYTLSDFQNLELSTQIEFPCFFNFSKTVQSFVGLPVGDPRISTMNITQILLDAMQTSIDIGRCMINQTVFPGLERTQSCIEKFYFDEPLQLTASFTNGMADAINDLQAQIASVGGPLWQTLAINSLWSFSQTMQSQALGYQQRASILKSYVTDTGDDGRILYPPRFCFQNMFIPHLGFSGFANPEEAWVIDPVGLEGLISPDAGSQFWSTQDEPEYRANAADSYKWADAPVWASAINIPTRIWALAVTGSANVTVGPTCSNFSIDTRISSASTNDELLTIHTAPLSITSSDSFLLNLKMESTNVIPPISVNCGEISSTSMPLQTLADVYTTCNPGTHSLCITANQYVVIPVSFFKLRITLG